MKQRETEGEIAWTYEESEIEEKKSDTYKKVTKTNKLPWTRLIKIEKNKIRK